MKRTHSIFRIITLALTLAVLMTSVVVTGVSAASVYGDYEYQVKEDGTVTITKYKGTDAHVEIPAEIDGKKVTEIGAESFKYNADLESVIIPYGVTKIDSSAFIFCKKLVDVSIPKSVTWLGTDVFCNCTSLEYIVVPGALTYMGTGVFRNCDNLRGAAFGTGTQIIAGTAFYMCWSLEEVILPNTVKTIGPSAFCHCPSLKEFWLPLELEYIDYRAFDSSEPVLYYPGTEEMLSKITAHPDNDDLFELKVYLVEAIIDVPWDAWYYSAVEFAVTSGLMVGTSATTFEPETPMNRAMLATVLWRLEGEPEPKGTTPFTDLKEDWYKSAVAWAYENSIVVGTSETTFSPNGLATREQMAAILYRYAQKKGVDVETKADLTAFPDYEKVQDFGKDGLAWANAAGIIVGAQKGTETYLCPGDSATRAQVAAIIMRYCKLYLFE